MAVDSITNFLLQESGRLDKDILQKTIQISPWLDIMPTGDWPEGMGYSVNVPTFGRSLPAQTYTDGGAITNPAYDSTYGWGDISTSGLGTTAQNNCNPNTIVVKMGSRKVAFSLQQFALESDRLCAKDFMVSFEGAKQLEAIKENLSNNTQWVMTEKFRRDFCYWCDNKAVVTQTTGITATTVGGGVANAETMNFATNASNTPLKTAGVGTAGGVLTNAYLQQWYSKLCRAGAGKNALLRESGAPVFALMCSMETSRRLKTESNYRDDYRWSSKADQLLDSIGVNQPPVGGFQHILDITPPRWNVSAGAWVKVEPYKIAATDNGGFEAIENTAYESAGWEDSIIFHKDVAEICFPGATANSSGTAWTPVNYRGAWKWNNIPDERKNPDGNVGYFRGVFALGAMPKFTNYGVVIRHARADAQPLYAAVA